MFDVAIAIPHVPVSTMSCREAVVRDVSKPVESSFPSQTLTLGASVKLKLVFGTFDHGIVSVKLKVVFGDHRLVILKAEMSDKTMVGKV